jgi:Mn2+/Fe2+ NRAMP family transporter
LLVVASLILSLTWGIYGAAYLDKAGDEMEQPLLLLSLGNPILAIAGVILTVSRIDLEEARHRWWVQVIASIVSAILAILALIMIFALP